MTLPLDQHQAEIQANRHSWQRKPLLREIYRGFYERILTQIDPSIPGRVLEIGSGIGNLREHFPTAIASDLFPNPWLDLVCDGYELPFADGALSHLILFDVFHHLQAPLAFFRDAHRALGQNGRVIIFDPFISVASYPAYGLFHHEPVALNAPINLRNDLPRPRQYYAAQGNATRLFFDEQWRPGGWEVVGTEAFAAFSYLLSGGFSKPALYPTSALRALRRVDEALTAFPKLCGGRCLVTLRRL